MWREQIQLFHILVNYKSKNVGENSIHSVVFIEFSKKVSLICGSSPPWLSQLHITIVSKGARLFEPKNAEANLAMAEKVKELSRLPFWIGLRDVDGNGVDYKLLSTGKLPSFTKWCVPCAVWLTIWQRFH